MGSVIREYVGLAENPQKVLRSKDCLLTYGKYDGYDGWTLNRTLDARKAKARRSRMAIAWCRHQVGPIASVVHMGTINGLRSL